MQNKKIWFILIPAILLVAAAAFVGGRLLNGQAGSLGFIPMGDGQMMTSVSFNMVPAPELPTTDPTLVGGFSERKDNTIFVKSFDFEGGDVAGGVMVVSEGSSDGSSISESAVTNENPSPKTEVVITSDTKIYRDATDFNIDGSTSETQSIQQVVEAGSLDDLKSGSMVMVWGRKSGDRIIADVISYSNPVMIQQ